MTDLTKKDCIEWAKNTCDANALCNAFIDFSYVLKVFLVLFTYKTLQNHINANRFYTLYIITVYMAAPSRNVMVILIN